MEEDGLLEEYYNFMENPERIPSDAYGQSLVNRVISKYGSIEKAQELIDAEKKKKTSLENKLSFIQYSDTMQLNPDRVFDNRKDKENLIRKFGYPKLYAQYKEGTSDFLSKFSDSQIGEFFKKTYYNVKKQLGK